MDAPGVSVVLVVRNGEAYIRDALASVTQSRIAPLEILVVDGGSSDRTPAIAAATPLVRVVAQRSTGIANAYNEGIAEARGELIAFISHDDLWTAGKLDIQVAAMQAEPGLLFTVGMVEHFLEPGCVPPEGFRRELLERPYPGLIMETLMARRRAFELVGGFDPSFAVAEDTDWFARAKDAQVPMRVLPQVLVRKRVHGTNASLNVKAIDHLLLRAMRRSIARKREAS